MIEVLWQVNAFTNITADLAIDTLREEIQVHCPSPG
jgi:hypothetical protein